MERARLDPDGYILPEASLDRVQPEFSGVPQAAAGELSERFGSRLHSGYVYGSVVRGNAVPGRSDLDLVAVLWQPAPMRTGPAGRPGASAVMSCGR